MHEPRQPILLLVAGAVLLLAGLLAWRLAPLDLAVYRIARVAGDATLGRLASGLSAIGGLTVMGPLALAVAIGLALRRRRGDALWLAVTIVAGRLLVEGIKEIVRRPRPPLGDRLADVASWSFPSSHSAGTMMTCLAFALLAGGRWPALLAALATAGAIGWSRVALGVHWPSDVLAGWGLGALWIGAARRWRPRSA
ncbi:MAG TPA: phosphatase PAP2 family protein [Sphingomonas sp.]